MNAKRAARQSYKAHLLDVLHTTVGEWEPQDESPYGLTDDEASAVHAEVSKQLYAWAVRLQPREVSASVTAE